MRSHRGHYVIVRSRRYIVETRSGFGTLGRGSRRRPQFPDRSAEESQHGTRLDRAEGRRFAPGQAGRPEHGDAGSEGQGPEGLAREPRGLRERPGARDPDPRARVRRFRQRGREVPRRPDARGRVHRLPPEAGGLRPAPGRRPDVPHQAAHGRGHARAARDVRRRGGGVRAPQQGPHHHAPEHSDSSHPAAPDGRADPQGLRRRPVLARGLRQHGAQRDRRPVGRHHAGRAVRHHPLRRRLRALLRAPPHHTADAAQGQDGVHGHGRGPRDHRHPRHRVHPARARRRARRGDPSGRGNLDHAARRADSLRLRRARQRRLPEGVRGGASASSTARTGCGSIAPGRASRC